MKADVAQQVEKRLQRRLDESRAVYLLGAGASVCAGLPTMPDLTAKIRRRLPPNLKGHYDTIQSALHTQLGKGRCLNIEDVLSELLLELNRRSAPPASGTIALFSAITTRVRRLLQNPTTFEHHHRFAKALCAREGRTAKNFRNSQGRCEMLWPQDLDEIATNGRTANGDRIAGTRKETP